VNRPLGIGLATALTRTFLEAVVAPGIDAAAAEHLAGKPRMRVLVADRPSCEGAFDIRSIDGGLLVQTADVVSVDRSAMTVATRSAPDEAEWRDLLIAWRVCRHVKSNAIVIVRDGMAVGVAGQLGLVLDAVPRRRQGLEPGFVDRVAAPLAAPVGPGLHPQQGGVELDQLSLQVGDHALVELALDGLSGQLGRVLLRRG